MADDLGEEWWLASNEQDSPVNRENEEDRIKQNRPAEVKRRNDEQLNRKRKNENQDNHDDKDENKSKSKRKKRKKKKNLSEHLATVGDKQGTGNDLIESMGTYYHDTLSAIEMEELLIPNHCFLESSKAGETISEYLFRNVTNWTEEEEKDEKSKMPHKSCVVLVLTSSAKRAVDLNRDASKFRGKSITAKLFAKHIKVTEQEKFLASHQVKFAIGTPHRVLCLLDTEALNLDDTRHVILDWNWRDAKLRRFVDIPELRRDLFEVLRKHVIPAVNKGQGMIGIF